MALQTPVRRHAKRPLSRFPLSEKLHALQLSRGRFTMERGERLAIPSDRQDEPGTLQGRKLWRRDKEGRVFRPGTRFDNGNSGWQRRALEFARDHIHQDIPAMYYRTVLGHDLHVSMWGDLYARHWHNGWVNPFDPDDRHAPLDRDFTTLIATHPEMASLLPQLRNLNGFVEDCGWLASAKVTDAFVSEEIDELVSTTSTEYADFDFQEVGTSAQAENNNDTALITTSGITRVAGTPTDSDPIYQNVGTITADATETWEEWGLFNNISGVALMDRALTGGQAVNSSDQVEYTYQLTKAPEA